MKSRVRPKRAGKRGGACCLGGPPRRADPDKKAPLRGKPKKSKIGGRRKKRNLEKKRIEKRKKPTVNPTSEPRTNLSKRGGLLRRGPFFYERKKKSPLLQLNSISKAREQDPLNCARQQPSLPGISQKKGKREKMEGAREEGGEKKGGPPRPRTRTCPPRKKKAIVLPWKSFPKEKREGGPEKKREALRKKKGSAVVERAYW